MLEQDARRSEQLGPAASPGAGEALGAEVEVAYVRSYDHRTGHSVRVTVASPGGEVRLAERHYLAPGQSVRLTGDLDPGDHELRVEVDGVERARTRCRLDGSPAGTAVVELGNGVVSVTEGALGWAPPS